MELSPPETPQVRRAVLLMITLNSFATPIMLSSTNVALPSIARDLQMDALMLSWVPMAFLMASAMFVLIFGKVADTVGRKRIFLIGTGAVIVTSSVAAMSINGPMLLGARYLQGISSAMLAATQVAIISSVFPAHERGRYLGMTVAAVYVGLTAGPLLGGLVIDTLGWRATFFLQVPLALIVMAIGVFMVKTEWRGATRQPFDARGAVTWGASIALFCLGVSRLPDWDSILILISAVLALVVFLRHARRTEYPLWDVKLFFQNRIFTMSSAAALIMYASTYANVVLLSLFLQSIKGLTASQAGMILMAQPACMAVLSPLMGRLSDKIEPRILASSGMAITAVGLFTLAQLHVDSSLSYVVGALLLTGVGFSLFSSPNVNAIMGSVEPRHYGSASGAVATTRVIGQLSSMVLVTLAISLVMGNAAISEETLPQLAQAIDLTFLIAGCLCLPGVVLSMARGRLHRA